MTTKALQNTSAPAAPLDVPPGITLEQTLGKLTGTPLYRIEGYNMPWADSAREALRVYQALQQASQTGYFSGAQRPPAKAA